MVFYFSNKFLDLKKNCNVVGLNESIKIAVGDVIKIFYSLKGSNFYFEGFCYYLKRKSYMLPDTGVRLIAKIKGYIITFTFSFFYNLIFFNEKIDFKKSKSNFRSATVIKYKNTFIL